VQITRENIDHLVKATALLPVHQQAGHVNSQQQGVSSTHHP